MGSPSSRWGTVRLGVGVTLGTLLSNVPFPQSFRTESNPPLPPLSFLCLLYKQSLYQPLSKNPARVCHLFPVEPTGSLTDEDTEAQKRPGLAPAHTMSSQQGWLTPEFTF
jgi:hypothetical protein